MPTWHQYVDSFLATVKPSILSYDFYPGGPPVEPGMDQMHYELGVMRNKSLAAGIPLWTYVWLNANGAGRGVGYYRWSLWTAAAYGATGIMQWSVAPCGDIHNCGPKARWAPYPCMLDKFGRPFGPVYNMARDEHRKLGALGPRLLMSTSIGVRRLMPPYTHGLVPLTGLPLVSISSGRFLLGHLMAPAPTPHPDCVLIVHDDPVETRFPTLDLGINGTAVVLEVDQTTGELVPLVDDAPDVAGFQLFFLEGAGRLLCWPAPSAITPA